MDAKRWARAKQLRKEGKDVCDRDLYLSANVEFMKFYKILAMMDIDARREIVQAGYDGQSAKVVEDASKAGQAMWGGAVEKFKHADDLIKLMSAESAH